MTGPIAPEHILSRDFDIGCLARDHPPRFRHANKVRIHELACAQQPEQDGPILYSRWRARSTTNVSLPVHTTLISRLHHGAFDYPDASEGETRWHLNFADRQLFIAYPAAAFAQDEIQVSEHPALASLREALISEGRPPFTVEAGRPTPILIQGAPRLCAISTGINPEAGRPLGMYGRRFANTHPDDVAAATKRITPPTLSNILAISAPAGFSGAYSRDQLEYVLTTAIGGFSAAVHASPARTVIHTGHWGCGAFGGDRNLMAMLQLLAARAAEVDELVFHGITRGDLIPPQRAAAAVSSLLDALADRDGFAPLSTVIDAIEQIGFEWGTSDGN